MNLAKEAYDELFNNGHEVSLKYSRRFKGYNANVKMRGKQIDFYASSNWRGVSKEIQKGLYQELLTRLFKTRIDSINIDLYDSFMKNLPKIIPKTKINSFLETCFDRVNSLMFNGMMETPNLIFGKGINQLGLYEYGTDTITISKILLDDSELLDYVMYHEMLHKKHQFKKSKTSNRTLHHSKEFRLDEAKFPRAALLNQKLEALVRKHKRWTSFF